MTHAVINQMDNIEWNLVQFNMRSEQEQVEWVNV